MSAAAFDREAFRARYSRFLGAGERVLLTGHSHQAWPDVARDAMLAAFDDAARLVDDKWSLAVFPRITEVGEKILVRLGLDATDDLAFAPNTHELVYRLLSCLPTGARVVTTTSEFHSAHRQLSRLAEEGLDVRFVDVSDRARASERLLEAVSAGGDLLIVSAVFFEDAFIVERLDEIIAAAQAAGMWVLVDAYHAFNVVPLHWPEDRSRLFVTGGGYKYAELGEGVCFLRVPRGCELRPRQTGWFADFGALEGARSQAVGYGPGGARFWGATFDPTPFYRAQAVLAHFDELGLDVPALRAISMAQTALLAGLLGGGGATLTSPADPARRGGFVTVRTPHAHEAAKRLRERGVFVDARGDGLRLGPAPYLTDEELARGAAATCEALREFDV